MKTVAIVQPSYIPWRGYFDLIGEVDVFVFLDDVQFTLRDWRTRNRIKLRDGATRWLSVPARGGRNQSIRDVQIDNSQQWSRKHLEALRHSYARAPFFESYLPALEELYRPGRFDRLSGLNAAFTAAICEWLRLRRDFVTASALSLAPGVKDDHLLAIVRAVGGDRYLSGPAARAYIRPELWSEAGIELAYKDYAGYPPYPQISEPFDGAVTVLDLLFMVGDKAPDYIWGAYRRRAGDQE